MNSSQPIFIPIPSFFSFQECIWFLNRSYDDCLHVIDHKGIRKALDIDGEIVLFHIQETEGYLKIEILLGSDRPSVRQYLSDYVRDWFDMDRDVRPFYTLLRADPNLPYMAEHYFGLRLVGIADLFEALCWSIIGQQINLTFAYKLKRRLVETFGESVEFENEVFYVFPSAVTLAGVNPLEMRSMQFSGKKAEYITGVAKLFAEGVLSKEMINALPNFESRQKVLLAQKGIGLWTANYALMKSLRESAGIPYGDVGLLNALTSHGVISDRTELEKIKTFFNGYSGWESYMVFYLWRSLAVK